MRQEKDYFPQLKKGDGNGSKQIMGAQQREKCRSGKIPGKIASENIVDIFNFSNARKDKDDDENAIDIRYFLTQGYVWK